MTTKDDAKKSVDAIAAMESRSPKAERPDKYQVRHDLRPAQLTGISEQQLAQHWTLYEGYVKNVNALNDKLTAMSRKKDFGMEFAALKRRTGFEYDGMILHERYFGILKSGQKPLSDDSKLMQAMTASFGSGPGWREEFAAMGKMRGVGWVILYYDQRTCMLSNHWIDLHEDGHPAGFAPILVMDVWEHAYMVDLGVSGRATYVEAFLANVDWAKLECIFERACGSPAPELHESECNA